MSAAEAKIANSVSEFIEICKLIPFTRPVFRGVSCLDYELIPSIGRMKNRYKYHEKYERRLFEDFRRMSFPFVSYDPESPVELLAIAQHHGLPTRLLDWTENSLVSLYFAAQLSRNRNKSKDGAVYILETDGVASFRGGQRNDPLSVDTLRVYRPKSIVPRVTSQVGLFTLHGRPWDPDELENNSKLLKVIIRDGVKEDILRELDGLGINPSQILQDLDGVAECLSWRLYDNPYPEIRMQS